MAIANPQMFGTSPQPTTGSLGSMPTQPVNMPGANTYQMPSPFETDNFDNPGTTGQTLGQTFGQMNNQMPQARPTGVGYGNQDINSQMRNLYSQGYSGGQLAAKAQQMGITQDQFAQATGIPADIVAQAYAGASQYQGGIGAPNRNMAQAPNPNPFGVQSQPSLTNSTDPYVQAAQQSALGNLAGAQQAVAANRVNQVTPYSNLQYQQTGTDANGNPIWTATQSLAPQLQSALGGLQGRVAQTAGQAFNPQTPSVGINPGETYSDAIMRRLQPQLERQNTALDAQLANQGIMPGSEAYNRAKTLQAQRQNDLLTAAQVGGINVGLQANQQGFNQALQQYNLPLTQLGAFQQATQPGYINAPAQAAVAGPDYLGAYTTGQAAQIAARNAEAARRANLTSGLFGLGATGLLSSGGLPGLINIGRGLTNSDLFNSIGNSSIFGSGFATPTMSGADVLTERITNLI